MIPRVVQEKPALLWLEDMSRQTLSVIDVVLLPRLFWQGRTAPLTRIPFAALRGNPDLGYSWVPHAVWRPDSQQKKTAILYGGLPSAFMVTRTGIEPVLPP